MANKLSIVTGASSGIGAAYADRLASRGSDLVLVARRAERLDEVAARARAAHGVAVETLVADLENPQGVQAVEARIAAGPIAMLVNCAGAGGLGQTARTGVEVQAATIALNITALVRLSLAALASFRKAGSGSLVNIASVVAFSPSAGGASYSGSKAFVLNFTRALQMEHQDSDLRIQAVLPGPVRTEFFSAQGMDDSIFPDSAYIRAEELVDVALAALDNGESVTIPTLKDLSIWAAMEEERGRFLRDVIGGEIAARYRQE